MIARCIKYPALYVRAAKVRFRNGIAHVTEEQADLLGELRFMVGITIDGVPAKRRLSEKRKAVRRQQREAWRNITQDDIQRAIDTTPDFPFEPDPRGLFRKMTAPYGSQGGSDADR